jgi:hypothetical protein
LGKDCIFKTSKKTQRIHKNLSIFNNVDITRQYNEYYISILVSTNTIKPRTINIEPKIKLKFKPESSSINIESKIKLKFKPEPISINIEQKIKLKFEYGPKKIL